MTNARSKGRKTKSTLVKSGVWFWFLSMVLALNWLSYGGVTYVPDAPPPKANTAQRACLDRLWIAAERFVGPDQPGESLPLAPTESIATRTTGGTGDYFKEDVVKACKVTAEQVAPGLPPEGFGGRVPLLEGLSGDLHWYFSDPERCRLPPEQMPSEIPEPRVMVESDEVWEAVVKLLADRNIVTWTELSDVPVVDGKPLLQGAFGVIKPGRFTASGLAVLRFIMDCRPTNAVMLRLLGDLEAMAGGTAVMSLVVLGHEAVTFCAEDLVSAFYLLLLPPAWRGYFTFSRPVRREIFGLTGPGVVYVQSVVLPMGFSGATSILQHWHRRAALGLLPPSISAQVPGLNPKNEIQRGRSMPLSIAQGSREGWKIFLDDFLNLQVTHRAAARHFRDQPGEAQLALRRQYDANQIPRGMDKSVEGQSVVRHLGYLYDGDRAAARLATGRCLEIASIGFALLEGVTSRLLHYQVYAGKAAHGLQLRRPLWSVLSSFWRVFRQPWLTWKPRRLSEEGRLEVAVLGALMPLCEFRFGGGIDGLVTASDASEFGLGVSRTTRLSDIGKHFVRDLFERHESGDAALPQPLEFLRSPVLLIVSLFDGIGGIRRAADRLRLSVPLYLSAEMCPKARRVVRACWPGVIEYEDVKHLTRSIIFALVLKATEIGVTFVIVSGGWPCQDVSFLNKNRAGVEGSRSSLFREFIRISSLCAEAAAASHLQFAGLGECTRMSLADQERISGELGWVRTEICSSGSSRVNRPRNYWTLPTLQSGDGFEVWPDATGQRGRLSGPLEPSYAWVLPDWEWRPGDSSQIRLPTFTRAIPRTRPPPGAPGLYEADSETLERYFGDELRFPPYTYSERYCVHPVAGGQAERQGLGPRVLRATEREILMGYKPGHTLPAWKSGPGKPEVLARSRDTLRCEQIGNSFHTLPVAVMLGSLLRDSGCPFVYQSPDQLQTSFMQEMGEAGARSDAALMEAAHEAGLIIESSGVLEGDALTTAEDAEWEDWCGSLDRPCEAPRELSEQLGAQWLAEAYVRASEPRGGEVRLDLNVPLRARAAHRVSVDSRRWRWRHVISVKLKHKTKRHINALELDGVLLAVEWRLRSRARLPRFLHLVDSQVALAVLCKGRSASLRLAKVTRRISARVLGGGLFPVYAYVKSAWNPSDSPSRPK